MTAPGTTSSFELELRARHSAGISNAAIYAMVARALRSRGASGGLFLDVGCGVGNLARFVSGDFDEYVGADAVRYEGFPADAAFSQVDLDTGRLPLPDGAADVVAAVETIEHLENPRAFLRELVRLAKPGGWVIVTTPNQLSLLSLLSLVVKGRFVHFQDVHYPAHLTALLEVDLRRIAGECGLVDVAIEFSQHGRVPGTARYYPQGLARRFPRALSDNVLMIGRKPDV
ncbi:MAG TPA: methyltransferase domain-containing protein [Longimicrobiaceae bacterium]|nr:methyltransferase domain-containing protein [Longimicrobiaceae bacterium]